jgi:hypothetical protein
MNDPTPAAPLPAAPAPAFRPCWTDDLDRLAPAPAAWLWQGFLAPGNITLWTSQPKAGKTTLLSVLLARLKTGGTLAGLPVAAGKAAVLSEESEAAWLDRHRKLDFGPHACWFCRPFDGRPSPEGWLSLLDSVLHAHAERALSLVAIDPMSVFFSGNSENSSANVLAFLQTLRRLTRPGLAVWLFHHPSKEETAAGLAARGSGALAGYVDVQVEMRWYSSAVEYDRRRRLVAFSRHEQTPRQLVIELTADGTDYVAHGSFADAEFSHSWLALRSVLADAPKKLTRAQITRRWPPDSVPPPPVTLWRWLDQAVAQRLLLREGTGRKNDPHRFWLPGQEEKWQHPAWESETARLLERLADHAAPLPPP